MDRLLVAIVFAGAMASPVQLQMQQQTSLPKGVFSFGVDRTSLKPAAMGQDGRTQQMSKGAPE